MFKPNYGFCAYKIFFVKPEVIRNRPEGMSWEEWCEIFSKHKEDKRNVRSKIDHLIRKTFKRKCDAIQALKTVQSDAPNFEFEVKEVSFVS